MLKRKKNHKKFSKLNYKKIPLEDISIKTMKVTINALRWVFLSILLFVVIGIFILFLMGGDNYIQIIIGYSITGFFTFFLGYFGWILARSAIITISGKQVRSNHYMLYYMRKHK